MSCKEDLISELDDLGIYVLDYEMYTAKQLADVMPMIRIISGGSLSEGPLGIAS